MKTDILVSNLKKAYDKYLSAIAALEDSEIDEEARQAASTIIQESQLHEQIALEQIQG